MYTPTRTTGCGIYKSDVLSVEIRRYTDTLNTLVWFETDVRCTPGAPLTSYLSAGKTPGRRGVNPIDLARDNHVVLGITDDFFGTRRNNNETVGIVIRNGKIISDKTYKANRARFPNLEVLAVFNDGSMKAYLSDAHTAQEYLDMGATDVFAFGPILVSDGQPGAHMGRRYVLSLSRAALRPGHDRALSLHHPDREGPGEGIQGRIL